MAGEALVSAASLREAAVEAAAGQQPQQPQPSQGNISMQASAQQSTTRGVLQEGRQEGEKIGEMFRETLKSQHCRTPQSPAARRDPRRAL